MSLQNVFLSIKSFFYYLFESFTMRTKPKYRDIDDEDEILYLTESMKIER